MSRFLFQRVIAVIVVLFLSACGGGKGKSTDTNSSRFGTLAQKQEFLERYVSFRRTYESLDYAISYHDGGDGSILLPGKTEWNIRLTATVPAGEIEGWIAGLAPIAAADTTWVTEIPAAPSDLSAFEWHGHNRRLVGIDRAKRTVIYRNRTF